MEIYCEPEVAESIIAISKTFTVDAQVIGRVEASDKPQVSIKSEFGHFEYFKS